MPSSPAPRAPWDSLILPTSAPRFPAPLTRGAQLPTRAGGHSRGHKEGIVLWTRLRQFLVLPQTVQLLAKGTLRMAASIDDLANDVNDLQQKVGIVADWAHAQKDAIAQRDAKISELTAKVDELTAALAAAPDASKLDALDAQVRSLRDQLAAATQ